MIANTIEWETRFPGISISYNRRSNRSIDERKNMAGFHARSTHGQMEHCLCEAHVFNSNQRDVNYGH